MIGDDQIKRKTHQQSSKCRPFTSHHSRLSIFPIFCFFVPAAAHRTCTAHFLLFVFEHKSSIFLGQFFGFPTISSLNIQTTKKNKKKSTTTNIHIFGLSCISLLFLLLLSLRFAQIRNFFYNVPTDPSTNRNDPHPSI